MHKRPDRKKLKCELHYALCERHQRQKKTSNLMKEKQQNKTKLVHLDTDEL